MSVSVTWPERGRSPTREASPRAIRIYDCTLREGAQASQVTFSVRDKLRILRLIDEIGFSYAEGGWPASNGTDDQFFVEVRKVPLTRTKLVAFGRTRPPTGDVASDVGLDSLIRTGLECGHVFGKGWDFQVVNVLGTSLERNLDAIHESIRHLKRHMGEVSFGFEHFFDACKANPEYARRVIEAAIAAGVDWIDLADTNGGCFPDEITRMVGDVVARYPIPFAVHCHDDTGCAVANTIAAVDAGVAIVEGTINGLAERCGMADLCTVVPNLQLKLGYACIPEDSMPRLSELARVVADIAHMEAPAARPYVGSLAFTHKGGVHVDAFLKNPRTYEHVDPALVGNRSNAVVSAVSGKANLQYFLRKHDLAGVVGPEVVADLLARVKALETSGSDIGDEALVLSVLRETGWFTRHIDLVETSLRFVDGTCVQPRATIEFSSLVHFTTGTGPSRPEEVRFVVEGNDATLAGVVRRLIACFALRFPSLASLEVIHCTLREVDGRDGRPSRTRAIVELADGAGSVRMPGFGRNVVGATLSAAVDACEFRLTVEALRRVPAAREAR